MPTLERRSIHQFFPSVASKGRRLFSRDWTSTSAGYQSRAAEPLRASALNLNEILEQNWSASPSPYCLSNQLDSPQPSAASHARIWGKDFGRRRSSNTTTTSTSSVDRSNDGHQRRRKSLFSKKSRLEPPSSCAKEERNTPDYTDRFVDPFACEWQQRCGIDLQDRDPESLATSRRISTLQGGREFLRQASALVSISAQSQMTSRDQDMASSPGFLSASSAMRDGCFYPIDAPPSPTSPSGSSCSRASVVASPTTYEFRPVYEKARNEPSVATEKDGSRMLSPSLSTMSATIHSPLRDDNEEGPLSYAEGCRRPDVLNPAYENHILLPSAMKRLSSREKALEADKGTSTSPKAQSGHGSDEMPSTRRQTRPVAICQRPSDWSLFEIAEPSRQPLPPLRPSRNPLRTRSKSLSSAAVTKLRDGSSPPPLPSSPANLTPESNLGGLVEASGDPEPLHTPPRSRRCSGLDRQPSRCESFASMSSSNSVNSVAPPPFLTPTFGSIRWTSLPVS